MNTVKLLLAYGLIHYAANEWREKTETGRRVTHFLRTWKTDWFNGILTSITVLIFAWVIILAVALGGEWLMGR